MPRPRKHSDGTTASDRRRLSEAARQDAGGARILVMLCPEAARAMRDILGRTGEARAALVERLLLDEARRGG